MIDFNISGRMIWPSKSDYMFRHRGHIVVFNANICTRSKGKIWHGDLDITLDQSELQRLAVQMNEDIFVLRERDARFEREHNPAWENAVVRVTPAGDSIVGNSQ